MNNSEAGFSPGRLACVMIIQFCMLNNRCQTEEREGVFAFLLLRTLLPQSSHFFSCHDSGNRSLSFSHAGRMLMRRQFKNVLRLGEERIPATVRNCAGEAETTVASILCPQSPAPSYGTICGKQKFYLSINGSVIISHRATMPEAWIHRASWPFF